MGTWRAELTSHGLEHIAFAGATVVPRLFFAVRDLSWATPPTPFTYERRPEVDDGPAEVGVDFHGDVEGCPLQVSGSIVLTHEAVTVSFVLHVRGDVQVSRAGPCILLDVPPPGEMMATDVAGPSGTVMVGPGIAPYPLASGHRKLSVAMTGGRLTVEFSGALFEMEDQRNWADSTLKCYCPPLSEPRPIRLRDGQVLPFAVRLTAEGISTSRATAVPAAGPEPHVATLANTGDSYALPAIGLTLPGGALPPSAVDLLSEIRPSFVHLLVQLGEDDWATTLADDLRVARSLGADAVLTVDCPPGPRPELSAVATIGGGMITTAFLFETGNAVTAASLADEGRNVWRERE